MASSDDSLLSFVASLKGGDGLRVEENLGDGFVRLRVSEAERRQAKQDIRSIEAAVLELLRNARDAHASHIYVATSCENHERSLYVIDDGDGIPQDMQERIFDARVTSKLDTFHPDKWGVHGRGMALYSIKENATFARVMSSLRGGGSAFKVVTNTQMLPEKADQSRWPTRSSKKESEETLLGPHNIIRTCVEFAYEEARSCKVYVGAPNEILATIKTRTHIRDAVLAQLEPASVCERIALSARPETLAQEAEQLGMAISERSAYRIFAGDIKALRDAKSVVWGTTPSRGVTTELEGRLLHLTSKDTADFSARLAHAFEPLEQQYYVKLSESPQVRIGHGEMTVSFLFTDDD